jgi:hypothetical protein
MKISAGCICGVIVLGAACLQAAQEQSPASESDAASLHYRSVINRYCSTCHNDKLKTADLDLSVADIANPGEAPHIWEKVVTKLRFRAMPPDPFPRPDEATYNSMLDYLTTELDQASFVKRNPGRPTTAHRLNRTQYTNAIRDLLGLEIDGSALLPADDSGGFDNLGEVLSVSPVLMERYLSAARKISRLAVGNLSISLDSVNYPVSPYLVQGDRMSEDLPFGTRGGVAIRHHFPLDGDYEIKVRLLRYDGSVLGIAEPHFLDVRLDGSRIKLIQFGGQHIGRTAGADGLENDFQQTEYQRNADAGLVVRIPVKAGARLVQVSFLNERSASEGLFVKRKRLTYQDALPGTTDLQGSDPDVNRVTITGPLGTRGSGDTVSRQKIFVCQPSGGDEQSCARDILAGLARRAYRRPVKKRDLSPLMKLYEAGNNEGGFEGGIEMALQGLLVSPHFLFRIESEPSNIPPETAYTVSDLELASRLSFFIWASVPDEPLLRAAEQLEQQVRRMLADSRATNLVEDFAGQWLLLRNVKTKTPNRDVYPEFDENLRYAFEKQTELFLTSMIREDQSVPELLNADYTFMNERLAKFYDVSGIYGNHLRRVDVQDENRRGILGHGSILLLTAYANRTSVVQRGKWVLENLLGVQVPPPPANVPGLKEKGEGGLGTLRQQMEAHRANPACMGCHSLMDPIGFALENFDGIGKWRTTENGNPIDPSGTLLDGTQFQGVAELRQLLHGRPELLVHAVTEKLLMYALGRTLEYYDAPAIREIVRNSVASDYRWSSIILGIARSTPFRMRRTRPL